jgi:hypothetical protein
MWAVGIERRELIERRRLPRYSTRGATVPRVLFTGWGWRAAARVRGEREASRGASPTAGKREGISF